MDDAHISAHKKQSAQQLYDKLLYVGDEGVTVARIYQSLKEAGIHEGDKRLVDLYHQLAQYTKDSPLTRDEFINLVAEYADFLIDVFNMHLVIPDFANFCRTLGNLYDEIQEEKSGKVACYIPELKAVDPEQCALAVCTVDGQTACWGQANTPFVVQSICKPINYCIALQELGEDTVHKYVGREPSGRQFNELSLNKDGKPHNPMINSGAIMICSLIKPEFSAAKRFNHVKNTWQQLAGNRNTGFNNLIYLSERETADRNFALGYMMRENKVFPSYTSLRKTLELYFQCCSIEITAEKMAAVAATLASGGSCPLTGENVFDSWVVKNCLSLMLSCGMYDFSGEFAFSVGLPAKSGVSGGLMIVVPNVCGLCVWSPRLDELGNSVKGLAFCNALVSQYAFHNYDSLLEGVGKKDPRRDNNDYYRGGCRQLPWAAADGDVPQMRRLIAYGCDPRSANFDSRTVLHIAASNGHEALVLYLLTHDVDVNAQDRWGNTPLDDALRERHQTIADILSRNGARTGLEK